jgi:putative transposase
VYPRRGGPLGKSPFLFRKNPSQAGIYIIEFIEVIENFSLRFLEMKFESDQLYHVYNQGNNQQKIFLSDDDYEIFLSYVRILVLPFAEVICYCLMPNHFHFLLYSNENSIQLLKQGGVLITALSNGFRKLLSGYCRIFNKKYRRSGSLFRQKTKSKCLTVWEAGDAQYSVQDYCSNCFRYIHENPVVAGLVKFASDWIWSSYRFYAGLEKESICNMDLAKRHCNYDLTNFFQGHTLDEHWIKIIEGES